MSVHPISGAQGVFGKIRRHAATFGKLWSRAGALIALLWLLDSLLSRLTRACILVITVHDASAFEAAEVALPAGYSARLANRQELLEAAADMPNVLTPKFIDEALGKGDSCASIFDGDRMVCFQWLSSSPTRAFDDITIQIGPCCLYTYNSFTAPNHRGQRLHSLAKRFGANALAAPSGKGTIAYVKANNASSLLSAIKIPGLKSGLAFLWPTQSRLWVLATPLCRRIGLHLQLLNGRSKP